MLREKKVVRLCARRKKSWILCNGRRKSPEMICTGRIEIEILCTERKKKEEVWIQWTGKKKKKYYELAENKIKKICTDRK